MFKAFSYLKSGKKLLHVKFRSRLVETQKVFVIFIIIDDIIN